MTEGRTVTNDPANFWPTNHDQPDPDGWERVHRTAIVRLGPDMQLYYPSNHGCLGVVSATVEDEVRLLVETDFDGDREICLHVAANIDATLAKKGIFVGGSGGGQFTRFDLYSWKDLPYGQASVRKAGTLLPPHSGVFDSTVDNLWLTFTSLRMVA